MTPLMSIRSLPRLHSPRQATVMAEMPVITVLWPPIPILAPVARPVVPRVSFARPCASKTSRPISRHAPPTRQWPQILLPRPQARCLRPPQIRPAPQILTMPPTKLLSTSKSAAAEDSNITTLHKVVLTRPHLPSPQACSPFPANQVTMPSLFFPPSLSATSKPRATSIHLFQLHSQGHEASKVKVRRPIRCSPANPASSPKTPNHPSGYLRHSQTQSYAVMYLVPAAFVVLPCMLDLTMPALRR